MESSATLTTSRFSTLSLVRYFLLGLLVLVLGVRLSFMGAGALTFPDEERYYRSVEAVELLVSNGDISGFCERLSQTQGRPGDALWRVVPAALQVVTSALTGLSPHDPASLLIPVGFNYLITLGSLLLYFRIAQLLTNNRLAALLSTLVYACLVNTNIYIRHVLPYDAALLSFFATVYWILRLKQQPEKRTNLAIFLIGAMSTLTFAIYPGYNAAVVAGWLLLLEKRALLAFDWKNLLRTSVVFGLGAAAAFLFFELLTQAGGSSYYESCISLSSTVTQGDFTDGFSFLFKYLFEVERSLGLLLTGLAGLCVPVLLYRTFRRRPTLADLATILRDNMLLISMLLAYLGYAVLVYYLEKMVFYGRILHLYIPFLLLLITQILYPASRRAWQVVPVLLVAGVAIYSFAVFARDYHQIVYPLTYLNQHAQDFQGVNVTLKDQTGTADNSDYYLVRNPLSEKPAVAGQRAAVLLNMAFMYPIRDAGWCGAVEMPATHKLTFSAPHFLTFPGYPFEGFTTAEREIIRRCQFQCQVYEQQ